MSQPLTRVRLSLGGKVIELVATSDLPFHLPRCCEPFLTQKNPELTLRVFSGPIPPSIEIAPVFRTDNWSLSRCQKDWVWRLYHGESQPSSMTMVIDNEFHSGAVYVERAPVNGALLYPLTFPLDQLLLAQWLADGSGVVMHAFGLRLKDNGLLFTGVSGAGKSTMASLWQGEPGVTRLSDDRVFVRREAGGFFTYGSPWHSDAEVISADCAPLEAIYILEHGPSNQVMPLSPSHAAAELLRRCFPTYWDPAGMRATLSFLDDLCKSVPVSRLAFLPDRRVVEYLRCRAAL